MSQARTLLADETDRYGQPRVWSPFNPQSELMTHDVEGDGKKITGLSGLGIGYKTSGEICIGARTIGNGHSTPPAGSGSWDDPYDVSTRLKFDTIAATAIATKQILRIRDSGNTPYVSRGHYAWYLRGQSTVIGEGIGRTVIQLDPTVGGLISGSIGVIGCDTNLDGNGSLVEGLTLDCNWANLIGAPSECAIHGIFLYGNNNQIRNVEVINGYGLKIGGGGPEHFGILLVGDPASGTCINPRIEYCIARDFLGDYGVAIGMAGPGGTENKGGSIAFCRVTNYWLNGGAADHATAHVVAYGMGGGAVMNNYAEHCHKGVYAEKGTNIHILNNDLRDISLEAIHINPLTPIDRVLISGNTIELRDDNPFRHVGLAIAGIARNVIMAANTVYIKTTGNPLGPGPTPGYTALTTGRGHALINNRFDASLVDGAFAADSVRINNRTLAGAVMAAIPDTAFAGPVELPTVPGTIDDILTLISPTKADWAARSTLTEFVAQKTTSFIPSAAGAGWYKICSAAVGAFAGHIRMLASYGTGYTDVEFVFDAFGYGAGDGTIQQLRCQHSAAPIITQARLSNNNGETVQLDVYIAYFTTPAAIQVLAQGPSLGTLNATPTLGAASQGTNVLTFPFSRGFDSSYGTVFDAPAVFVDGPSGSNLSGQRLSKNLPFATIQAAVDAAVDGDEIIIGPGNYDEEVTVKAGTYVITLQHGAIWKQTTDAACLKSANVTCDFTINGDLSTEDDGAVCVAMVAPCPNCTIRVHGDMHPLGAGSAYVDASGAYHDDGKLYIDGDIVVGATQVGLSCLAPAATAHLEMSGDIIAELYAVNFMGANSGTAIFRDCNLSTSGGTETVKTEDRDIEFTRCTLRSEGSAAAINSSGSAIITLHEFCHLISGNGATELSAGPLAEIVLDGVSFTNKPKEGATTLSGAGYLLLETSAATRDTGWTAMTGTAIKTTIAAAAAGTASVGYVQAELQGALNRIAAAEARMKGYDEALIAAGLIGT